MPAEFYHFQIYRNLKKLKSFLVKLFFQIK
jgi:hypothetical protein